MVGENPSGKKCRGRPATFDRDELIAQVMELFWERGYGNLSLNEVARVTGLSRASLYNAFATKEALFLEVIERYLAGSPERILKEIGEGDAVGPALHRLFETVADQLAGDGRHRGCLAVNCMTEQFSDCPEVAEALEKMNAHKKELFKGLMVQAIAQHEVPEDTDPHVTANMLQAFMYGLSLYSRNGVTREELRSMAGTFLQRLGFIAPAAADE